MPWFPQQTVKLPKGMWALQYMIFVDTLWYFLHMAKWKLWIFHWSRTWDKHRTTYSRNNHMISGWWFGTFFFPFSWEFHHPNWRTPSFFRGVGIPPTSSFPAMWTGLVLTHPQYVWQIQWIHWFISHSQNMAFIYQDYQEWIFSWNFWDDLKLYTPKILEMGRFPWFGSIVFGPNS